MPELPEVENIALGLKNEILRLPIRKTTLNQPLILKGPNQENGRKMLHSLTGRHVSYITRRAKRLILMLDNQKALLFQLGMTGRFSYGRFDADDCYLLEEKLVKHTHLLIDFEDGSQLRFVDPRRFGRLWLFGELDFDHPDADMERAGMGRLGPEPFDMTPAALTRLLQCRRPVKSFLLDQTRIAGLGNIYADESLFASGIYPETICGEIGPESARLLLRKIKTILRQAIRNGGTTFSDYRNPYGDMGRFRSRLKVYGRDGQSCKSCKNTLEKVVIAGRSSHYCPVCQPPVNALP